MLPKSLKIYNFRSIGATGVDFGELKKINLIIGQNNTGKSNVIAAFGFIGEILDNVAHLTELNRHLRDTTKDPAIEIEFEIPSLPEFQDIKEFKNNILFNISSSLDKQIITSDLKNFLDNHDHAFEKFYGYPNTKQDDTYIINTSKDKLFDDFDNKLFSECKNKIPEIKIIPEFRQISEGSEYSYAGKNLVKTLAELKSPPIGQDNNKLKFKKILKFFIDLMDMPKDTDLDIPLDYTEIIVDDGTIRLPLSNFGTGVHQIIILLTAIMHDDGHVFGIEEPEIHLHPTLQQKLIRFLLDETNSSFFISTHSASIINEVYRDMLNNGNSNIIHLTKKGNETIGNPISNDREILSSIYDLGVSANELLQYTCLIWVEGPSDMIYIKKWLSIVDPELEEDIHFHFLPYGGSLLTNYELTESDQESNNLINILKVNRNSAVVIDSDLQDSNDDLREVKKRIQAEAEKGHSFCWITHGREIENYLPNDAIAKVFSKEKDPISIDLGEYDKIEDIVGDATESKYPKRRNYASDKAKYARRIVEHISSKEDFRFDLNKRIKELSQFIRKANSM